MNYREYQQVMKLSVSRKDSTSSSTSSPLTVTSNSSTRASSPLHSPLSSPRLAPHCSHTTSVMSNSNNNYKIQKKPKITRSKTGCLCCRRRRKKCDEVHPKCGGCTRNFLDCVWPGAVTPSHSSGTEDETAAVPASFSLNNNIMIIQDEHLVTQTSKEKTGDNNFIITAMKSGSANHIVREHFKGFPKAISIKSLLN